MKIKPSDDTQWRIENGDNTYRVNYNLNNDSIVVDLGARHGHWSDLIRNRYSPKIYCFEVVPQFCNELIEKGYNTFCVAVSDKKEKIKLGIFESEASIFYEESNFESEAISASQIFNLIKHNNIDLMKINVEGAEYQILEELINTKNVSKIKNLQVQFHLFDEEENNNYNNLVQKLSETHELLWRFPFVWENWVLKNK
jgi:FkbM family methyltransferase